eukprot:SAG31_NODE_25532_length_459_cov_1.391667_1_plen_123_part_01
MSGQLDASEFQNALKEVGIKLSEFETQEVMAEIDLDAGGDIDCAEMMDKLKQFQRESFEKAEKCRSMFDELDADQSGFLDPDEIRQLADRMGFDLETNPAFVEEMIAEMDNLQSGELVDEDPN